MLRLLMIAQGSQALAGISSELIQNGFACSITPGDKAVETAARQSPDLLLVETDGHLANAETRELIRRIKQERPLPVMALVARENLGGIDGQLDVDDFLISPYDTGELALRIKRLLRRNRNTDGHTLIECGGLVIDLDNCEVTLEGRIVELTFKEYELLKLLAGNRGRVYTREALLNRVWGDDYYGGDRTVDVHVRRLRSKIEDSTHSFIETVRNIGYRFRKDAKPVPRM